MRTPWADEPEQSPGREARSDEKAWIAQISMCSFSGGRWNAGLGWLLGVMLVAV